MKRRILAVIVLGSAMLASVPVAAQDSGDPNVGESAIRVYLPVVSSNGTFSPIPSEPSGYVLAGSNLPADLDVVVDGVRPDEDAYVTVPGDMRDLLNGNQEENAVGAASIYDGNWGTVFTQKVVRFGNGGGTTSEQMTGRNGWYGFVPFKTGAYLDGFARAKAWNVSLKSIRLTNRIAVNGWSVSFGIPSGINLSRVESNVLQYDSQWIDRRNEWSLVYRGIRFEGVGTNFVSQTATGIYRWNTGDFVADTFGHIPQ